MALDKNLIESFEKMLDVKEENIAEAVSVDGRSKSYKEAVGRIKGRKNIHMTKSVMTEMDLDKDMEEAVRDMVNGGDDMDTIKGKVNTMIKDKETVSENKLNPSSDKNLPDAEKATIATSNADNRGKDVEGNKGPHKQGSDSHGDTSSNLDNKGTHKSDASAEIKADKGDHNQGSDSAGDTKSNPTISNPGTPEKSTEKLGDVKSHDQYGDSHGDLKGTPLKKLKEEEEKDSDDEEEMMDEAKKKKMKEDEIVIKTDGDKGEEKPEGGDKPNFGKPEAKPEGGDKPNFGKPEAKPDMSKGQKDVDVDDDGDIGSDDLADLRKGKSDADVGVDDGTDQESDAEKADGGEEKKNVPPFMKKEDKDMDDEIDSDKEEMDEAKKKKMKEDEIVIKTDGKTDSETGSDDGDETLGHDGGDSEAEVNKDKDSLREDEVVNNKFRPEDDKKNDKVVHADNRGSEVEADKGPHKQGTDKHAETSTGGGAPATSAEADKAGHDQEKDPQDGSSDHTIKGHGAGEKGVEADKGAHDQSKDKITEGDLSEDFKARAKVIFETAVNEKVGTISEGLEKEFANKLEEEKTSMEAKIAEFTDYAVKEWLEENKLEVKYSLRTEIAEGFIGNLKKVFEDHYISIPNEDIDVVDELTESVESFKDQVEESGKTVETLQAELLGLKKGSIVSKLSEDLTDTQKIRLAELSDSVEASDVDEFESKLAIVKESYFAGDDSSKSLISSLTEEVNTESSDSVSTNGSVDFYANWLSSTTKSNNF